MATLNDAIKLWQEEQGRRAQELETDQAEKRAKDESFTKESFGEIGLVPDRIEGQSAFFRFEDKEIQFIVVRWKHVRAGFCRVLDNCEKCQNSRFTDQYQLTLENVGWMLSDPQKRYHECWGDNQVQVDEVKPVEKTNAELLIDLINALIDEKVSQFYPG